MYKINNKPMTNYGLHISKHDGHIHLFEPKEQFFTVYGKQGYQITKRKANILHLKGFLIADNLADFMAKVAELNTVFSDPGIKAVELDTHTVNCFAEKGSKVTGMYVFTNAVYAKYEIKLTIV